jgi:hypothetical protein
MPIRRLCYSIGGAALLLGMTMTAAPAAAAAPMTCSGTPGSPGVVAGTYSGNLLIEGFCTVNGGPAVVKGNLTVGPGAVLLAVFARNDQTRTGNSSLRVAGNLQVQSGATLLMGCEPNFFTCLDDRSNTLSSSSTVQGNLVSGEPLGVIVHNSSVGGNVVEAGGGGGVSCQPAGPFAAFHSPVYSDYEDNSIGGNLVVSQLASCWLGVAREAVKGNTILTDNQLADPDAIEILSNHISGNLVCEDNSVPFGDFHDNVWDGFDSFGQTGLFPRTAAPNTVNGQRLGECVLASPTSIGGPLGPGLF